MIVEENFIFKESFFSTQQTRINRKRKEFSLLKVQQFNCQSLKQKFFNFQLRNFEMWIENCHRQKLTLFLFCNLIFPP